MQSMEKCSPDPPTAPLGLASLEQGGGDLWHCWHVTPSSYWSPTSPQAPIGRHSARKQNRDSGAGWRYRVMQSLEKTHQILCPSDKRIYNPFLQSNTTARWESTNAQASKSAVWQCSCSANEIAWTVHRAVNFTDSPLSRV